jgi:hypothetical protein
VADRQLSILIGGYGDYPQYTKRCIESVVKEAFEICDIHVGLNACGYSTRSYVQGHLIWGTVDTLIDSRANLNKDRMMRLLLAVTETPYVLWLDDDSHLRAGWLKETLDLLSVAQIRSSIIM